MAVHCEKCGARVASRAALAGHSRRAHGRRRSTGRAIVPACPKPIRGEILDVTPSRSEIVRAMRPLAPGRPVRGEMRIAEILSGDRPPAWFEPGAEAWYRAQIWAGFPPEYRRQLVAEQGFLIRTPEMPDQVVLWGQYHALKALAIRLDAGVGTERELAAFEAGLLEYERNFDRIRARRKALPA